VTSDKKAGNVSENEGAKMSGKWGIFGRLGRENRSQKGEFGASKSVKKAAFLHAEGLKNGYEGFYGP